MRKTIEFQPSRNIALTRNKPNAYEDLVLVEALKKFRHRFEPGKTKIRLLPAMSVDSNWLIEIPVLQHSNGRHTHPRVVNTDSGAQSVYDLAYRHMKENHPNHLYSRTNKSGIRLLTTQLSICWAIVEDSNGVKLRLLLHNYYDGSRGGAAGLGRMIHDQVLRYGDDSRQPGHPLNPADGTSLWVERIGGSDVNVPNYRVSLADDRGPLAPLLEKVSDMEYNALCDLEKTIRILDVDHEWQLLAKVIGHDLAIEVRAAHERANTSNDEPTVEQADEVPADPEESAFHPDDYKDFPKKWEI